MKSLVWKAKRNVWLIRGMTTTTRTKPRFLDKQKFRIELLLNQQLYKSRIVINRLTGARFHCQHSDAIN